MARAVSHASAAVTPTVFVSPNRLEGSLCDTPLDRLLEACKKHLVTGAIAITSPGKSGRIELRAGAVDHVELEGAYGPPALSTMRRMRDGLYELTQRLPELDGSLGVGATLVADAATISLNGLMRHCEYHALSCTISVLRGDDRAELQYRAGDLAQVIVNGHRNDDVLAEIVRWTDARFEIAAPPLDRDIEGWPRVERAPTVPFRLEHAAAHRPQGKRRASTGGLARGTGLIASVPPSAAGTPAPTALPGVTRAPAPVVVAPAPVAAPAVVAAPAANVVPKPTPTPAHGRTTGSARALVAGGKIADPTAPIVLAAMPPAVPPPRLPIVPASLPPRRIVPRSSTAVVNQRRREAAASYRAMPRRGDSPSIVLSPPPPATVSLRPRNRRARSAQGHSAAREWLPVIVLAVTAALLCGSALLMLLATRA